MKNIILLFLLTISVSLHAQKYFNEAQEDSAQEVGIYEHLGDTIPLQLTFKDENDSVVILKNVVDKPTIFTFVYFDCPRICSSLLDGVSTVIEQLDMQLGKDYQVITISFNYMDNPVEASVKKNNFLRKHSKSNVSAWKYLTGDSTNIYRIVNAVGFKFKRAGVDFIHPASIMVVSPKGKITRYLYGISFNPFDLKMALIESQQGLARPTISKVLDFCYAYDPASKRYAMDILKVTGSIIIFLVLVFGIGLFVRYRVKK